MSTAQTNAASAANVNGASAVPKVEDQAQGPAAVSKGDPSPVNWDSEIQLVSSLAKLQELERKIHEMRHLLPQGTLDPLVPVANPNKTSHNTPIADSPHLMRGDLDETSRASLSSIQQFQSMWRSPELGPVWARVEARINESNGQLLQPSGKWEKDYDVLLEELVKEEKNKEETHLREDEDAERAKALSTEGGWLAALQKFIDRDVPGVRVIRGQQETSLVVALVRAGIVFMVQGVREQNEVGVGEWQVSSKIAPNRPQTKLEGFILDCLSSRPRKWDLTFLLDMISSYADIKQTPCTKCSRLTDNAAQLPAIRRAQQTQHTDGEPRTWTFEALHISCTQ
ncbi:hypothetical protein NUU61_005479 [Penicillium alfredii]|uniref:Mediator complex subunit 27 n=1 Tax=Penicillium alfredii TaxID=1506179 RepID=A0A9W9F9I8_9EURO|nr:uncharacterized protein NUU61_005479 [Penicillium alfredii]KAJ5096123.1 hypothetical protein NUU61_005479 [Penicillium alfredii]